MQQKIKDIKLKFRQAMNGIVSQNMRNLGANYKINFGLTLPLLKKIAEEIPADAQLANALWNDTAVRESMMLAPMLYPSDEFNEDEAEKWVTNMPTPIRTSKSTVMESLRQDDTTVYRIAVSDSLAYRPPRNKRHFDIRADSRYRTKKSGRPKCQFSFSCRQLSQTSHAS